MSNSTIFKVRLKRTRKNKNLTQEQLAEAVGLRFVPLGGMSKVLVFQTGEYFINLQKF